MIHHEILKMKMKFNRSLLPGSSLSPALHGHAVKHKRLWVWWIRWLLYLAEVLLQQIQRHTVSFLIKILNNTVLMQHLGGAHTINFRALCIEMILEWCKNEVGIQTSSVRRLWGTVSGSRSRLPCNYISKSGRDMFYKDRKWVRLACVSIFAR